jgi:molybdopterin/thiamine biosynthesis adenylyltransferase
LHPCLAADTSLSSRTLRAGPQAHTLAKVHVTIVGCGAVGSYVADLLYREGVRRFLLVDPDIYRPGNVIRHAAPARLVGQPKVQAVADALLALDLGAPDITFDDERLSTPEHALRLVRETDVVIDATADERATALLRWASHSTGRPVISACTQRDGGIARADRFPPTDGEEYLPAVPLLPGHSLPIRERGCGDAVSPAPPAAVVAAAELAVELARGQLVLDRTAPASVVRVLQSQPDEPYRTITTMTSAVRSAPGPS